MILQSGEHTCDAITTATDAITSFFTFHISNNTFKESSLICKYILTIMYINIYVMQYFCSYFWSYHLLPICIMYIPSSSTVTVALSDFVAVPKTTAYSPKMRSKETFKWGDLSNLPLRIQWLKKTFKSKTVAVLYGFITQRFVYHHLCVCN